MLHYIAARHWLTVYQLPSYSPQLNPVEAIRPARRRSHLANTAFTEPQQASHAVRRSLREIQYRSDIIDGRLTGTRLTKMTTRAQSQ